MRQAKFRMGLSESNCVNCKKPALICFQVVVDGPSGESLHDISYCECCLANVVMDLVRKQEGGKDRWDYNGVGNA